MERDSNFLKNKSGFVLDPNANFFMKVLSAILMYLLFFFFMLADFLAHVFQFTYFNTFNVPKINRSDYVIVDRQKLSKLTFIQKIACIYCGYANGVISWIKAILVQVEIYSCAIKHHTTPKGQFHHEEEGYDEYDKYL